MTRDFAKPSTTKTPGRRSKERPNPTKKKSQTISKKQSSNSRKTAQSGPGRWVVFLCIALIAGFAVSIYFLNKVPPTKAVISAPESQGTPQKAASPTKTVKKEETKERFKFYDLLPESEVIPPKVDAYQYKEKGAKTQFEYILQTGSFRSHSDAERQRAMIGLQGLKARVNKVESAENGIWYRVQIGPFTSRSKMNSAMDRLVAIHIQPLVKKNKR